MPRNRVLAGLVLGVVMVVSALVVVLVVWERQGGDERAVRPTNAQESPTIDGRAVLTPRIVLFGDTLTARVDVVLDRSRVDPDSVRVAASFTPWEALGEPERMRRDVGSTTYLRTTYVLRCLTGPCAPSGQASPLEFDPARVAYAGVAGSGGDVRDSIHVTWPLLTVYSRFASAASEGRAGSTTLWRADVLTFPNASHRVAPGLVLALLLGAGVALAGLGLAFVYMAWPRRAPAPPPEPEAPPPRLTPLQQALVLLEDAARTDGAEDRRRSLELVAEALEKWGDDDLARSARVLAWSEDAPEVDETAGLAARVRSTLEAELEAEVAAQEGNGRVD